MAVTTFNQGAAIYRLHETLQPADQDTDCAGRVIPRFALPFPEEEYTNRHQRIREAIARQNIDATIVTAPRDFHWLTGTRVDYAAAESPQWLLVRDGAPIGIVRHLEASTHRCCSYVQQWVEYRDEGAINPYDPVWVATALLKNLQLHEKRIGINMRIVSAEELERFQTILPNATFCDFRAERIRVKRSERELACIRKAVEVNQNSLRDTLNAMHTGWSEWHILKYVNKRHEAYLASGYFRSAWGATSCQVGRNMMHMHAVRTPAEMKKSKITKNCGVWLEPGVFVNEHVGCMIRTAWFGTPPTRVVQAVDACCEALERLITIAKPCIEAFRVDAAARDYLTRHSLDIQHRSGYMTNEKWMDGGILSLTPRNPLMLEPGQVFHCPIHVYIPDIGYVGVSEQILITDTGCEVLGDSNRTCERNLFVK